MNEPQPLQPLNGGLVLIVGAKNSNFDEEILTHPRVILWSSQQEHWTNKDLPSNVRAVFVTRWIGHAAFGKILAEARKRHITMFNPEGTGMIAKQVRELLSMTKPADTITLPHQHEPLTPIVVKGKIHKGGTAPKLIVLLQYVDWSKNNTENAKVLMTKLHLHNITSTDASLANFIGVQRKKLFPEVTAHRRNTHATPKPVVSKGKTDTGLDVSVQLLDDAIRSLQDIRAFLISTTEENTKLRARLDMFKKALEG